MTSFRLLLGGGVLVIAALVLGPPVAGWFQRQVAPRPGPPATAPTANVPTASTREPARAEPPVAVAAPGQESAPPEAPLPNETTAPASPPAEAEQTRPAPKPATRARAAGAPPGYRVQVGAFLDHRNADRLVARLRAEGFEVVDSEMEQSRELYRVVALPAEGEGQGDLTERLRSLGFPPEVVDNGAAVTGLVPLRGAVETARQLRKHGVPARIERAIGTASFRVVRVGRYATAEEAERARAELAARGLEGLVVRER